MSLTRVTLLHIEAEAQHWLRFGQPCREAIIDRRRRHVWFGPGDRFGYIRWRSNGHGTVHSQIWIVVAARPGAPVTSVPGVVPGGDLLLHLSGWPKVKAALDAIDRFDTLSIDPADAAPDHWRQVHASLLIGLTPRSYSRARHRAWQKRTALLSC